MLSPWQEMMIDRCSSGSGSISGGSYNSARMEWSTQASARYASPPPATPRTGAGAVGAAVGNRPGPRQAHGTIRVIHIFAPKIIKTDVANFKHLVQKLTGNSSTSKRFGGSRGKGSKRSGGVKALAPTSSRGQQILSHYRNATQIFASSNRVEYVIPRSSAPGITPKPSFLIGPPIANTSRSGVDFYRRDDFNELMDIKPVVTLRNPSFIGGGNTSTSDQSCSPRFLPVDISSPRSGNFSNTHQSKGSSNMFFNRNSRGAGTASVLKPFSGNELQWEGNHGVLGGICSSSPRQPLVTDPFQSLSGYKEKLSSPPLKSSSSSSTTTASFPPFDERNNPQNTLLRTGRFSEMEILTGLDQPGPRDRENLPDAPSTWPTHHPPNYSSSSNSPPDFTFTAGQLSNASSLCRFSVQSPLHGGVPQLFENY